MHRPTRLLLLPAALVATLLPLPATAGGCRHLLSDPANDVDNFGNTAPYPAAVDDPAPVDLRWAELSTTRTELVATLGVKDLTPEGTRTLDHAYSVSFRDGARSVQLIAMFGRDGMWGRAETSAAGDEEPDGGGVYVGRYLGPVRGTLDPRHDRAVLSVDLAVLGGVRSRLTEVAAQTWGGLLIGEGGTYSWADRGRAERAYHPGAPACLR